MKLIALALFAVALSSHAQTAKVIALSPEDVAKAKRLYAERDRIEAELSKFLAQVGDRYTSERALNPDGRCRSIDKSGTCPILPSFGPWINGFEFSEDFKFIVPRPLYTTVGPITKPSCWPYVTPAGSGITGNLTTGPLTDAR